MSNRYKGGVISATPPTTTGGESGTASGAWTLEQQMQLQAAGLWPSQPPDPSLFIENLFSTYLYLGNNSVNTITNGIDLAGKGGLVWIKGRTPTAIVPTFNNILYDTTRGVQKLLESNTTDAEEVSPSGLTAFTSTGFVLGSASQTNIGFDASNIGNFVSWTFREQPKFFDVVTYTGTGSARTVAHNLGSTPGCIIIKAYSGSGAESEGWRVYHRSQGATKYAMLQSGNAFATASSVWNDTAPTSSTFTVGSDTGVNGSGLTYIAYLFAHDAGGFGLTGSDNVVSCGTFSGSVEVNLGYEAQWVLIKDPSSSGDWYIIDTMRGMSNSQSLFLRPNLNSAEGDAGAFIIPTATGFKNVGGGTFIYIAIRRGPMKTPTVATTVFSPNYAVAPANPYTITTGFPVDLSISAITNGVYNRQDADRLRGNTASNRTAIIQPNLTDAETASGVNNYFSFADNTAIIDNRFWSSYGLNPVNWNFRRAPGFFDEVCYTGTGSNTTVPHNLGVAPELVIIKARSFGQVWVVGTTAIGFGNYLVLNTTAATASGSNVFNSTAPTSTVFSLGTGTGGNQSTSTYVAYLFATLAGVSKVGSYTGTGAAQTINCGFTAGCRFLMIKRTDSTGDWVVYDTARGFTTSPNSFIVLNSTVAEVAGTNYAINANSGFQVTSYVPADFNTVGATYIFLAIA